MGRERDGGRGEERERRREGGFGGERTSFKSQCSRVQQLKVIMINSILADSGDRDTSGPACWADPVLFDTSLQSHVLKL